MFIFINFLINYLSPDELSALQSEQDMPIEELLKLYGYNNAANGAASQDPETSQQEETKTARREL